jgi:hypothetical protein
LFFWKKRNCRLGHGCLLGAARQENSATAGLAFVKFLQAGRALDELVCAFEIKIVETHKVSLWVAHQPVSPVYVQDASIRWDVGGFFHLNGFHQERLD